MNAIEMKDVCKSFPGFMLDHINLNIEQGSVVGLVGENGAGKSTTIKLLLNMLQPDEGSITILSKHPAQTDVRDDIGVVFDEACFPSGLNAVQIGNVLKGAYKNWDTATYEKLLHDLDVPLDKPFSSFSRGMKMKISLAAALSHNARLLLLDEATAGLDPLARDQVMDLLLEFARDENHTVVLSSHIVSDLEKVCDSIAFLHKGKLFLYSDKDTLLDEYCLVHCDDQTLKSLEASHITACQPMVYGNRVLMKRENVPGALDWSPVGLEEMFIMMAKEKSE